MATERTKLDNWGQPQLKVMNVSKQMADPTAEERIKKETEKLLAQLTKKYGRIQ